jgi:hypothetical protein
LPAAYSAFRWCFRGPVQAGPGARLALTVAILSLGADYCAELPLIKSLLPSAPLLSSFTHSICRGLCVP